MAETALAGVRPRTWPRWACRGSDAGRRYRPGVEAAPRERRGIGGASVVRAALVVFVLAWLFGPYSLRATVPIWIPFLIALGLEVHFFAGARRAQPARHDASQRLPQDVDRERYGFGDESDDLLLVRRGGEELWIPYSGEASEDVEALIAEASERADDAEREAPPPTDVVAPGRRRRPLAQLVTGLAVIATLMAVAWVVESRAGWDGLAAGTRAEASARFSAEASRIAGHPVVIRCDESGDYVGAVQHADGVAAVGGELAYLTPQVCLDLYRLAFEEEVTFSQTARALGVLAHEAWHLRGVRDEGKTECYALQSGVDLGRRLGLSEKTARRMMRHRLAENTLRSADYVVPPECRDDGSLDLRPGSSEFP